MMIRPINNVELSPRYNRREIDPVAPFDFIPSDFSDAAARRFLKRQIATWHEHDAKMKRLGHGDRAFYRHSAKLWEDISGIAFEWSILLMSEDEFDNILRRYARLLNHSRPRGVSGRRLNRQQRIDAVIYFWRFWSSEE